jgi:hypothetical protein
MAQSAVGAIRAGCQMLSEGKAFIDDAKSEVEGIVSQVKDTYETVSGLWEWVKGLLGTFAKPNASTSTKQTIKPTTKSAAKSAAKTRRAEISFEEAQARAVHEICDNLKIYFEAIRQLKIHCRELEEEALTTEKVADSAIDRIEIQWQMKQLSAQLKQSMIYGTPESLGLGAMYQEFLLKQDEIVEEQEVARELKRKKERDTAWQQEHREQILLAKLGYAIVLTVAGLWMMALFSAI